MQFKRRNSLKLSFAIATNKLMSSKKLDENHEEFDDQSS